MFIEISIKGKVKWKNVILFFFALFSLPKMLNKELRLNKECLFYSQKRMHIALLPKNNTSKILVFPIFYKLICSCLNKHKWEITQPKING